MLDKGETWEGKYVSSCTDNVQDILQVFFAITMSAIGVSQAAGLSPDLTKVKIAVNSVFALLDRESKIDPLAKSGKTLKVVKGEVELQHISFTYPTRPTVPIFQDLSLTVHAGKVNHIVQLLLCLAPMKSVPCKHSSTFISLLLDVCQCFTSDLLMIQL